MIADVVPGGVQSRIDKGRPHHLSRLRHVNAPPVGQRINDGQAPSVGILGTMRNRGGNVLTPVCDRQHQLAFGEIDDQLTIGRCVADDVAHQLAGEQDSSVENFLRATLKDQTYKTPTCRNVD